MNHEHCEAVIWTLIGLWTLTWFSFCHLLARVIRDRRKVVPAKQVLPMPLSPDGLSAETEHELDAIITQFTNAAFEPPELEHCRRLVRLPFRSGGEYRAACETLLRIVDERGEALANAERRVDDYAAALTETDSMLINAKAKLSEAEQDTKKRPTD